MSVRTFASVRFDRRRYSAMSPVAAPTTDCTKDDSSHANDALSFLLVLFFPHVILAKLTPPF